MPSRFGIDDDPEDCTHSKSGSKAAVSAVPGPQVSSRGFAHNPADPRTILSARAGSSITGFTVKSGRYDEVYLYIYQ